MSKTQHKPRTFISSLIFCAAALLIASASRSRADVDPLARVRALLALHPVIDGHNDLPWAIRESTAAPRDVLAYDLRRRTTGNTDFERLRQGGVGGQFWSVYVPAEKVAAKTQLEQIDIARRVIALYPDRLALATSAAEVEQAMRGGRIASLLGMEGGHAIENSLGALRAYYALGARYMTLTHSQTLDWADSATDEARHVGPHALRRGGGARDEPARHAGRPLARLAGDHGGRAARLRGAGDLLALLGARALRPPTQRARRRAAVGADERRRRDGDVRDRVHLARARACQPPALEGVRGAREDR